LIQRDENVEQHAKPDGNCITWTASSISTSMRDRDLAQHNKVGLVSKHALFQREKKGGIVLRPWKIALALMF
jgi:hypothetical protein